MNVLSLDLDFFMHGRATNRPDSFKSRPDEHGITPWRKDVVVNFLTDVLNVQTPRPGRVVRSHHEVFYAWRDAIKRKSLEPPFFVCHVDAHADLGLGTPSWVYLHSDFLELSLARRMRPRRGIKGLNFASFMPYAIGNRWVERIDFVTSEDWRDDIPRYLLRDEPFTGTTEFYRPGVELTIELMHAPRAKIDENLSTGGDFIEYRTCINEPAVPFCILDGRNIGERYAAMDWDFIFLSHSPGYVPTSGDFLLKVISPYIVPF
ncbi:MAG: UPF0489 family protein [Georgfuchsia sp.]